MTAEHDVTANSNNRTKQYMAVMDDMTGKLDVAAKFDMTSKDDCHEIMTKSNHDITAKLVLILCMFFVFSFTSRFLCVFYHNPNDISCLVHIFSISITLSNYVFVNVTDFVAKSSRTVCKISKLSPFHLHNWKSSNLVPLLYRVRGILSGT